MSTDIGYQNQEHIAGEPADNQAKPIPPLNGNYTTSQVAANTHGKKPRKVFGESLVFYTIWTGLGDNIIASNLIFH